jgi:hypothetical protein
MRLIAGSPNPAPLGFVLRKGLKILDRSSENKPSVGQEQFGVHSISA